MSDLPVPADVQARMVALRRDLHQHPELSGDEHRTMDRIAAELVQLGIPHRTGVGGTGIVAEIAGANAGPLVALRADTDALPIVERTGLSFASRNEGVMHACGHDGHTGLLMGAAVLLLAEPPPSPVRLLWQPAEEHGTGAAAMIADGALDGVSIIFGGHLDRLYPPGTLAVVEGPVNASTDTFRITVTGRQGHGARPHETIDSIVAASAVVTALQTVVSRLLDPSAAAVISVGSFHAGNASNVIAGTAILEGTFRAQAPAVRAELRQAIERLAPATAAAYGAVAKVEIHDGTPPVVNGPLGAKLARQAAVTVVGEERVVPLATTNMGGEDFARYLERVNGCYIRFGSGVPGREQHPAHSSEYDIHEDAMSWAAAWMDEVARTAGRHLNS